MELAITSVPAWVSILFLLSFPLSLLLIPQAAFRSALQAGWETEKANRIRRNIIAFYVLYMLAVAAVSLAGFFQVNTLPPRLLVFTAVPLLGFYVFYFARNTAVRTLYKHAKLEDMVRIHLFRFVGAFFLICHAYDALPARFAWIGGMGDILTALFALGLLSVLKKQWAGAKWMAYAWNVFGMLDIMSVITTAILITRQSIEAGTDGIIQFATFPFSWIPAVAPATILFLHFITFRKIRERFSQASPQQSLMEA